MTIPPSERRFLLDLARDLLAEQPSIKTSELAHQMGVSVRSAYNYRTAVAAGAPDPQDPVQLARQYLLAHPEASAREVGAHLGLGRDSGRRYRAAALDDIARRPPPPPEPPAPKHTYEIPRFLPKKG